MNHKLTYLAVLAMFAASCSSDDVGVDNIYTLSEDGSKTPIAIETNLSAAPKTRAFDKTFESGDVLLAYIEAGKLVDGTFTYEGQFHWAGNLTLGETVDNGGIPEGTGLITTSDKLSPTLYWDDFSSTDYDLREDGRGIRLKYGYCFNGGTPSTDLVEGTGVLGWTASTNQTAGIKPYDLLWAETQTRVKYAHSTSHEATDHGTLVLPYTHAMSKVTINVVADEGFKSNAFYNTQVSINNFNNIGTFTAPSQEIEATAKADIKMYKNEPTTVDEKPYCTFEAMTVPHTNLSIGNTIATITDVDGNDYIVPVTQGILDAWQGKLTESEEEIINGLAQAKPLTRATIDPGKGWITEPGINYVLTITVKKTAITIRATIADWDEVKAYGEGKINFTGDVTEKGTIAEALQAKGFDVYKSSTNDAFSTKSTTVTYADSKWTYDPTIYWQNKDDNAYFRAISPAGNSSSTLAQGTDLMWGTSGNAAIAPRTGDVALDFDHLMSKLCVNLETTTGAAAVDLTGATIKITNLATTGTFSIVDGSVSAGTTAETMLSGKASGFTEYVVPQTIGNDARLIITLADGTTYSLQLNQCVVTGSEEHVTAWTSGKSYTYTIHLEKEKITFRALVKNWDNATGSGNATLEWD